MTDIQNPTIMPDIYLFSTSSKYLVFFYKTKPNTQCTGGKQLFTRKCQTCLLHLIRTFIARNVVLVLDEHKQWLAVWPLTPHRLKRCFRNETNLKETFFARRFSHAMKCYVKDHTEAGA